MQNEYITLSDRAPQCGDVVDGMWVINVSHEFPTDGFSYDQMRAGGCLAYCRVTLESVDSEQEYYPAGEMPASE